MQSPSGLVDRNQFFLQIPSQGLGTRGRALIISNSFDNTRHARQGSEHDYDNIRRMLDQFGFITVGDHRNFTAQVYFPSVSRILNIQHSHVKLRKLYLIGIRQMQATT